MITTNIALGAACLFLLLVLVIVYKYMPRRLNQRKYLSQWQNVQAYCKTKITWSNALDEADKLLKRTLKKRRYKGKSMGEKMVAAQKIFSDNDALWYAHNLHKKVLAGQKKLRQSEVMDALRGYRQALRDLGALPKDGSKNG